MPWSVSSLLCWFFLLVYALEQFFIGIATQLHCITSVTKVYIENSA